MGLFSRRERTTVGTSVVRVIEDDALPDAVQSGLTKALLSNGDIPEYVLEEITTSLGTRAERFYKYAENNYIHGLPSGEIYSNTQGRAEVEAIIEAAEGQQVALEYSFFGPMNALHNAWTQLILNYGYNPATNEVASMSPGKTVPVYLTDLQIVVPSGLIDSLDPLVLRQWGRGARAGYYPDRIAGLANIEELFRPSAIVVDPAASSLSVRATVTWKLPTWPIGTVLPEETFTITTPAVDPNADYFHAKYRVGSTTKYWTYQHGLGTYPTLDAIFAEAPVVSGSYFPFVYFRFDKTSVVAAGGEPYEDSVKLLDKLGMDFDQIADGVNANPDIADVENAMMMFGVPPSSTDPLECRYLFEYFDQLYFATNGVSNDPAPVYTVNSTVKNTVTIQDAQFRMALNNDGILWRITGGSIGPIGTHTTGYSTYQTTTMIEVVTALPGDGGSVTTIEPYVETHTQHFFRRQIAETLYEEIEVRNLESVYWVEGEHSVMADETDPILLIPIDRTITAEYSLPDREKLYSRSLHFMFHSLVVSKAKWYQTGLFQLLMIVIAIVITIYTYGADGGSFIATALGLSGTAGLIATIVVTLVIGQLAPKLYSLFVKAVGQEAAIAIAVLIAVYGGYQALAVGGNVGYAWAQQLLSLASGMQQAVLKDKVSDLLEQRNELTEYIEEQTKILDSANELLENQTLLQPFVLFGEKPDDFFNRTVHFGNIGTLGITAISSYVDIALTLPTIEETVGDSQDV